MQMLDYLKRAFVPITIIGLLTACSSTFDSILFSLVKHPQHPKERLYEIREVEFTNPWDDTKLAGELTYPSTGDVFPGIVLVSGHDGGPPADRNDEITGHKYFLVISDLLTKRGYAVLRFDNRGVGESSGSYATASDDEYASDAAAALKWLRESSGINLSATGFLGHSQGGAKSLIAATKEKPDYIVTLGSLGTETIAEDIIRQNIDMNNANGVDKSETDTLVKEYTDIFEIIRTSDSVEEVRRKIEKYVIDGGITDDAHIQKVVNYFGNNWWFKESHRDQKALLQSYDGPVLGLFGSKDLLVSASYNEKPVRKSLTHPQSEVYTFEGLNHLFQVAKNGTGPNEYWEIETTIEVPVIDKIEAWLDELLPRVD